MLQLITNFPNQVTVICIMKALMWKKRENASGEIRNKKFLQAECSLLMTGNSAPLCSSLSPFLFLFICYSCGSSRSSRILCNLLNWRGASYHKVCSWLFLPLMPFVLPKPFIYMTLFLYDNIHNVPQYGHISFASQNSRGTHRLTIMVMVHILSLNSPIFACSFTQHFPFFEALDIFLNLNDLPHNIGLHVYWIGLREKH